MSPGELGRQVVAAHADQWAHLLERDDVAVRTQRIHPRARVSIVAVDQRAIDVEEDGAEGRPGGAWSRSHARPRSSSIPPRPPVPHSERPPYLSPAMTS